MGIQEWEEKQNRIAEAKAAGLCVDCFTHKATVKFSEGALDAIHGFAVDICKCCYFKRVETAYNNTKANYEKLGMELREEGCQ